MKAHTLSAALQVAQMLKLLSPLTVRAGRDFEKALARINSNLQEQVLRAVQLTDTPQGARAETRITEMRDALASALTSCFNIPKLLAKNNGTSIHVSVSEVLKDDPAIKRAASRMGTLTRMVTDEALAIALEPGIPSFSQTIRANVFHPFASAVRNNPWIDTLARLGLPLELAADQNLNLYRRHSSHQGRTKLAENLELLCPGYVGSPPTTRSTKRKAASIPVADLFYHQVALDGQRLAAHPVLMELASIAEPPNTPTGTLANVGGLVAEAIRPVRLGPTDQPAELMQERLDSLIAALTARKDAIQKMNSELKKKAQKAALEEARAAVKKLDPKLLKLLKANPELLSDI